MILGIRHTGLAVRDMEASLAFYTEVFGLALVDRSEGRGALADALAGAPGAVLERARLAAPDGSVLELLHSGSYFGQSSARLGPALVVDDLDAVRTALKEGGLKVVREVRDTPDGSDRALFCLDPDDYLLEVAEEPAAAWLDPATIDLIVYDFDGVMTDNRVEVREDGLESVTCSRGDGWGGHDPGPGHRADHPVHGAQPRGGRAGGQARAQVHPRQQGQG